MIATGDSNDTELAVYMSGYEYNDVERVSDIVGPFTVANGATYIKTLTIKLPDKLEQGNYRLRVMATDKNSDAVIGDSMKDYQFKIDTSRHGLQIKDVVFSPETKVKSGNSLLTTVRIKNVGQKNEEGVRVMISIPELDVSASDYIDNIKAEDSVTSEELYLRIPKCAKPGEYDAKVTLKFNEGSDIASKDVKITVIAGDACEANTAGFASVQEKTMITIGPESQNVVVGDAGAVYPVTISNAGNVAKTYTISVEAGEWANVKVSPTNVLVLNSGETKAAYIYVAAKEGTQSGEKTFAVKVIADNKVLKEVALKANVAGSSIASWDKVKKGLEIGLVVLVVLLVVIGLIVGFNKMKGSDETSEKGQTYY